MKLAIGGDHAGYRLKEQLAALLREKGHDVVDFGAADETPSDWPDFAGAVAEAVATGKAERGIVVCGSGVGACVASNKYRGVRASLAPDLYTARQSVEHDDVNVLCLGSRVMKPQDAQDILLEWLKATYTGEERHARRLAKLKAIETRNFK